MNEYSDISFIANLDPFAKKKSKNDLLKVVQNGHPILSSQENVSNEVVVELSSFAQHKKFSGPKWMSDISKWTSKNPEFTKLFELKVLQIIDEGIVDMTLLMSIYESLLFEGRCKNDNNPELFITKFVDSCAVLNSSFEKYVAWKLKSIFSTFIVENFEVANFITLKDQVTNQIFHVYDNLGFATLKIGQKLVCRIVQFQTNYTFTGGFVLSIDKGYCTRYHKDSNTGYMYSSGLGLKILKDELDLSSNYSAIYSYFRIERDAITNSSYYNTLSFDDALSELNYLIIKYNLNEYIEINLLVETIENYTINPDYIKELKKNIYNKFSDFSEYLDFFMLFGVCIKKHPKQIKEKINLGNNLSFANQLWDDIQEINNGDRSTYLLVDEVDLKASKELLNINGDAISNYNKSVDLVISKKDPITSLKMIVNSFRISDELNANLLCRWYLTMSLNLINIGEISLAYMYFDEARKFGAETSRYEVYFQQKGKMQLQKVLGRATRFDQLHWGNLVTNILNNSDVIFYSKILLESLINSNGILLNSKGKFKHTSQGTNIVNQIISARTQEKIIDTKEYKSINEHPVLSIIYELLSASGLIEIKEKKLQITSLGKIYFYTKPENEIFELLLVAWLKLANWKNFAKFRNSNLLAEVNANLKSNIYRLFNFMYSKGTSSFTFSEIVTALSMEYNDQEKIVKQGRIIKSKLWGKVFVNSIYEVLQLYGIMSLEHNSVGNLNDLTFKLTDDGIYLLGKIESEIDKMVPQIVKKIIN